MKKRAMPFILICLVGPLKLIWISINFNLFNILAWLGFSLVSAWIGWAYWRDRDMPSYAGDFRFKEGNNFPRTLYAFSSLAAYVFAALVDWN